MYIFIQSKTRVPGKDLPTFSVHLSFSVHLPSLETFLPTYPEVYFLDNSEVSNVDS